MKQTKYKYVAAVLAAGAMAFPAFAADYTLRAQTYHAETSISGGYVSKFVEDVKVMSGGRLVIEMTYSSALVKSVETFSAAAEGILDIDMTGGLYQTGKNPAFQFVGGDVIGGYDTPMQYVAWLKHGGGRPIADDLYGRYGMHLVGFWPAGQESFASLRALRGFDDLEGWKFRSPQGLETEIFASLGASPIVMDFTEIFTALQSGIIDGADASSLANNEKMGIFDIGKHTTFPGWHSMPSDHLAINKDKWEELPEDLKRIVEVAFNSLSFDNIIANYVANFDAAERLEKQGVTFYDWSQEDRDKFRKFARENWERWAEKNPETRNAVNSHIAFLKKLRLID